MTTLSETEANKLFEQVSKATRENDSLKLSELMSTESAPEVEPVETPPVETPVVDDNTEEAPVEESTEEQSPPEVADTVDEKDTKEENPELAELRERLEKLNRENHALKSQAGRVPHVQRRLKELDRKLEELTKQTTSPSSQPSTKIQPEVSELLKGIKDTDPDLADAIAKAIAKATDGVAEVQTQRELDSVRAEREEQYKAYQREEATRLVEMYPNAVDVFKSPSWSKWKSEQTPQVLALAESDSADDVSFAFQRYADDMKKLFPEAVKDESSEGTTPAVDSTKAAEAQRIEAQRQRKKENAVNISNPSAPGKVSLPDDPQALFEKFTEQIRKELTGK